MKDQIMTAKHKRWQQAGSTVATYFSRANAGDSDLKRAVQEGTFALLW